MIRIFSSVDRFGTSRRKGKDSIKVCLVDKNINKNIGSAKTTYRIKGWQDRLKKKVNDVYLSVNSLKRCRCGSFLVERKCKQGENKGRKFLGCSNWPECQERTFSWLD